MSNSYSSNYAPLVQAPPARRQTPRYRVREAPPAKPKNRADYLAHKNHAVLAPKNTAITTAQPEAGVKSRRAIRGGSTIPWGEIAAVDNKARTVVVNFELPASSLGQNRHLLATVNKLQDGLKRIIGDPTEGLEAVVTRIDALIAATETNIASVPLVSSESALKTKAEQGTIGVYSSDQLQAQLRELSVGRAEPFAQTVRLCFEKGLQEFDALTWTTSSTQLRQTFESAYANFNPKSKSQWSLRLPRQSFLKTLSLAHEYGVARSEFSCWCLAQGLLSLQKQIG